MGWLQTTEWTLNHPSPFSSLYWQHGGSSKELREQLSQQLTAECSSRSPNLCNAGFVTLTQSHWDGMYQKTTVLGRCTFHVQTFTRCAVHLIYAEQQKQTWICCVIWHACCSMSQQVTGLISHLRYAFGAEKIS